MKKIKKQKGTIKTITEKEFIKRGWVLDETGMYVPRYKVTGKGIKKSNKLKNFR